MRVYSHREVGRTMPEHILHFLWVKPLLNPTGRTGVAEQVGVDFAAYKTDVEGYIRQGIVGYDGTTPIIGIAIGQDIRTTQTGVETERGVFDEIDKSSNMSVWTTEKLSFYIGGQEAAYFSNGKLTVAQIATDRITGSGKWDVSFTSGVKYKWIGG